MTGPITQAFVCLIYVIVLIGASLFFRRREDPEGYLIANRKLGFAASAITIVASKIGAGLLITFSVLVFTYGYSALALFVGYVIGYVVFFFFASMLHRLAHAGKYFTMADFFGSQYGRGVRRAVAFLAALSMFGWVLTNFIGGGKLLSNFMPVPFWLTSGGVALVVLVYISVGGFNAVVRTDAIQFVALMVLLCALFFTFLQDIPSITSFKGVAGISSGEIIVFLLTGTLFPLGSAELWERVFATESLSKLKKSLALSAVVYLLFGALLAAICIHIRNTVPNLEMDTGLIVGLSQSVPKMASGLVIIAFASAILSSADTFVYACSSVLAHEFIPRRDTSPEGAVRLIRILVVPVVGLGWVFAVVVHDVIDVTYYFASITLGLGVLTIIVWVKRDVNPRNLIAAGVTLFLLVTLSTVALGISNILPIVGILSVPVGFFGFSWLWRGSS